MDVLVDGLAFSSRQDDVCVEVEQSLRQLLFALAENTDSGKTKSPEFKRPKRAAVDRVEVQMQLRLSPTWRWKASIHHLLTK